MIDTVQIPAIPLSMPLWPCDAAALASHANSHLCEPALERQPVAAPSAPGIVAWM